MLDAVAVQPGVNSEQGLGIKSAVKDKPFILTEDPAQRGQFIVHANGEQVEFSSDVNKILIDVLGEMEQRAKESRLDAPDVVLFGSLAYNKALAIEKFRAEHPIELPQKGQPEQTQTPNEYFWTREDMAIAYFAVLAKYRADLAYLAADPNPNKKNLAARISRLFKQAEKRTFSRANKPGVETDLAIMGRFDSLSLSDQDKELQKLDTTLRTMQTAFLGDVQSQDVLSELDEKLTREVLGGHEGRFMMHDYIVDQIVGSDTRKKEGILTRAEYQERYYKGQEWISLTRKEQSNVWSKIDIEKKDEIMYEAIERSVGDWAENAGQKILREVRGESLSEDMRKRAEKKLENQKTVDKISAGYDKVETERKIGELEPQIHTLEGKLKDFRDTAKDSSIPQLTIKLDEAVSNRTANLGPITAKVVSTNAEFVSADTNLSSALTKRTAEITLAETARTNAVTAAVVKDKPKIHKEYTKPITEIMDKFKAEIERLTKEVDRTRVSWEKALEAKEKLDSDVTSLQVKIKSAEVQEKAIIKQLDGTKAKDGLRKELEKLKNKKAKLDKEGEHAGEVLTPEGEAIKVDLAVSEESNYNSIIQAFFQSRDQALGSLKIDGNTHTSAAIEEFRRMILAGLPDFQYESHKAELYISQYDIIRNYARAFRINLNIPESQQDAIAKKIGELNGKLISWDGKGKIPNPILNNRDELNTLLKPCREKILREIFIRNKFELGNAVRFTIRGMLEKAALGDPFLIVDSYEDQPAVRKAKPGEPSPPPPELYRRLDGDETPIGRKAIVLKDFVLSDGNEYFLVIRQDPKDGQVKQELCDDSGRKTEFSASRQEEVYAKLAVNTEKDNIKSGAIPEYSFTDLGPPKKKRKFNIDKASGRMIETEGPESGGFLEDLLKSNGIIQKHFLEHGKMIATIIEANLTNYIISTQDKIGIIDTRAGFEGPMTWHDEKVPGHARESLKVVLGNGLLPGSKTKITEVGIHIVPAIPPVSSFKEFDKRFIGDPGPPPTLPQLEEDRGKYFYAALFDRFSDKNSLDRRFITNVDSAFNNMPDIITASGTYRVRAENGKFIRTKVADSAGLTIPQVNRQDEELFDGFNKDLESDPNCDNVILNTKMELGRRFMKFLFETYAEPKDPRKVVTLLKSKSHRLKRYIA